MTKNDRSEKSSTKILMVWVIGIVLAVPLLGLIWNLIVENF